MNVAYDHEQQKNLWLTSLEKRSGSSYEEGLVDSTSPEDFNARLENCKTPGTHEKLLMPLQVALDSTATLFITKHKKSVIVCVKMSERLLGLGLHLRFLLPMHQKA